MFDFSKVHTERINRDFILGKVSESQIFYAYFGPFEFNRAYNSKFRKDNNASTGFYINKTGRLIYNDIKTGEKLDCFAFVAKLLNITYSEALKRVAIDFNIIDGAKLLNVTDFVLKRGAELDGQSKKKTIIQVRPRYWTDRDLTFWREYEITKAELIRERVYPVDRLYINKQEIYNPNNYLRFAYIERAGEEAYAKIYSPADPRMKWVSNIPLNLPFGLNDLSEDYDDTLIITKSKKDLIVLKKIFKNVIATQNESISALSDSIITNVCSKFQKKIIFWDNDETGVENCKKFNSKGFGYFNIPKSYYEKFKIKDASDFVAYYGIDALKELLTQKGIL